MTEPTALLRQIGLLIAIVLISFLLVKAIQIFLYHSKLKAFGWRLVKRPSINIIFGLNNPPFGCGYQRYVAEQIIGRTSTQVPFQSFRYWSSEVRDKGYVVTMELPHSLPEFYLGKPKRRNKLVQGTVVQTSPWDVVSSNEPYACQIIEVIAESLQALATNYQVNISIDHNQLVAFNAPKRLKKLNDFVTLLAELHTALINADIWHYLGEDPPQHLSFYQHPTWIYENCNDAFLTKVKANRKGYDHKALDIVRSDSGIPFIALRHTWLTQHKTVSLDGKVKTKIKKHTEEIVEFFTFFPFHQIGLDRGKGTRSRFELEAFNRSHKIVGSSPRFTSDVFHQRQLEYILQYKPLPFEIESDGRISITANSCDLAVIDFMSVFFHGFFGRVPDFVWRELGAWPRPLPKITQSRTDETSKGFPERRS